jgi:hypothetical protein
LIMIIDLLDRPIAYHRCFVSLTGSVTAAVLLSQAVYWSRRTGAGNDGWFWKTGADWEEETGLTRYEQEGARKTLRSLGFWEEEKRGIPARLWFRLDLDQLERGLHFLQTSMGKTSKLVWGKPADSHAENQQTISENTPEITSSLPPGGGVEVPFPSRAAIRERLSRDQSVILGALRQILPTYRRSTKLEDLAEIAQELGATGNQIREFPSWAATRYPGRAVNLFFVTDYLTQYLHEAKENTHGQPKQSTRENHDHSTRPASAPRETQQQRAAREFARDQAELQERIRAAEARERHASAGTADQAGEQPSPLHA